MGLAKLSDGTSSAQKQPEEKRWTKKGAAIVAELVKCYAVPYVIVIQTYKEEEERVIGCTTDMFDKNRLLICRGVYSTQYLKSCVWDEYLGAYYITVTSDKGIEVCTELRPDTKIRVDWPQTEYYDAETILSLEGMLLANWEHPVVELNSEPSKEAEEIKKNIRERLAKAIGIPSMFLE